MRSSSAQKRSIVLVPLPFQGHMTPMLHLGSILHSKGFSIIVAHTEFNYPNPLNHPQFVFFPLADKLSGFDISHRNLLRVIADINQNCRQPLMDSLVEMMEDEEQSHGQICCIIHDTCMHFVGAVASQLKIPTLVLSIFIPAYIQSFHDILKLHAENGFPVPDSKLEDPVPGIDALRYRDLPIRVSSAIPNHQIEFFSAFTNFSSSVATIWNTTEGLEHSSLTKIREQNNVPYFAIGPLHKIAPVSSTSYLKEDRGCISWLDKQAPNSVLYVSSGSIISIDEKEFEEMAWGLADSDQPFLWVIRPSSVNGSEQLPDGFQQMVGNRGLIVKWAPQKEVLKHPAVGGFWTHCGWNSALESIEGAVPLICRPCFADQMVNCRYFTHVWKIGLELDYKVALERGIVKKTIRRLMVDNEGEEIRQRMLDMNRELNSCVQKGGSSYNSLNDLVHLISSFSLKK